MLKAININKIDPSPFQIRKQSDRGTLKELAASIEREGQIEPIVVRRNGGPNYQLIAGGRRFEAVRERPTMPRVRLRSHTFAEPTSPRQVRFFCILIACSGN